MVTIKISRIRFIGLSLLIINVFVFFVAWLHWYISIPAVILLMFGLYMYRKNIGSDDETLMVSKGALLLLFGIMLVWVWISGLGGAFPQKADLHMRNAILHDLINYTWPVRYSDSMDTSLAYYFAFWLVPALIGKLAAALSGAQAGWIAANFSYALYCAALLFTVMLLLIGRLKAVSIKRLLFVAGILIFFSGMDIIPALIGQIGKSGFSLGAHLEWWANRQYSSDSTQLCWVYNQAVPAWLVTSLLLHEKKMNHFAFLGGLLLPYGPLPFIGLFFIMAQQALLEFLKAARNRNFRNLTSQIFTLPNMIAACVVFPVFYLFYSTNSAASTGGFRLNTVSAIYFFFIFFEFLVYVLLIWRDSYKKPYFAFSVFGLLIIPMFSLGNEQDFCMRASIPLLFILMVYVADYILNGSGGVKRGERFINRKAIPLILCLVIGAVTPFAEYRTSINQAVQNTSFIADRYGTVMNKNLDPGNFVTNNSSKTLFYQLLAKNK